MNLVKEKKKKKIFNLKKQKILEIVKKKKIFK